ncbi:PrsW family intramembrane metalloprotease [Nocardioides sp. GXZ039]|uniref:PrsW family intramembrane metalloprotease n=1 Tax=Nocardioides sp. GXZ039 TaxID=3136018 RepID=UPI0030F48E0C
MLGRRDDSLAFTLVVGATVVLGALTMLTLLSLSGAPTIALVAVALAALPVVPLVACFVWLDRYEPEPTRLLVNALLWGACAATAIAVLVDGVGGLFGPIAPDVSLAVVAPIAEESSKALFLVLLLWWRRREIDGVLDGIVYAGLVGVGFAFTENVLYLTAAYDGTDGLGPGGLEGLTSTFLLRCLVGPFAHPLFTAFAGIGIGLAVTSGRRSVRMLAPIAGFSLAVIAHGVWNASTLLGRAEFAGVYAVLMVPAVLAIGALALWARRDEARMLTAGLEEAARRGLIPATDIGWVVDLRARRTARQHAARCAGREAALRMAEYQQALIELGFLHDRLLRGTAPDDWSARAADQVERIRTVRPHVAFPGQVVPTA